MTLKCEGGDMYMDGYLYNYVERVRKLRKKDWDLVIIIDGKERAGKSKLAQTIGVAIDSELCMPRITITPDEFHKAIMDAPPGSVVIMDESMTAFFSKAAMSKTNINLVRMLAECGQKNLIIIIVLPSIFVLDSYLALHRASCLFHVYTNRKGERGYFKFYDRRRKKKLFLLGKQGQEYKFAKPNFKGRFTNYQFPWEEEYRKKKHDSLMASFDRTEGMEKQEQEKIFQEIYKYTNSKAETARIMRLSGHKISSTDIRNWKGAK